MILFNDFKLSCIFYWVFIQKTTNKYVFILGKEKTADTEWEKRIKTHLISTLMNFIQKGVEETQLIRYLKHWRLGGEGKNLRAANFEYFILYVLRIGRTERS